MFSLCKDALTFSCAHSDALNHTLASCTHEQDATLSGWSVSSE